jgi:hypothetical protein
MKPIIQTFLACLLAIALILANADWIDGVAL